MVSAKCRYIDECKYYDDKNYECHSGDADSCSVYRSKRRIDDRIDYNRKIIK